MNYWLTQFPEEGWVRIGPYHLRDPHGIVYECIIGDRDAIMHVAPGVLDTQNLILNLMEVTLGAVEELKAALSGLTGDVADVASSMTTLADSVTNTVKEVHELTAIITSEASKPAPSVNMAEIEAATKQIATLHDNLQALAARAKDTATAASAAAAEADKVQAEHAASQTVTSGPVTGGSSSTGSGQQTPPAPGGLGGTPAPEAPAPALNPAPEAPAPAAAEQGPSTP